MLMNDIVPVIAAATALCAVLLGPLVSLWAANKQARIALRANNRQAWINTLREVISEFSSTARVVSLSKEFSDRFSRAEKLFFLEEKMKLLVNPKEDDHRALIVEFEKARVAAIRMFSADNDKEKKDVAHEELKSALRNITDTSQTILKREWERVKAAE